MTTIMLTGATGFLGSHILRSLLDKTDCRIIILKRPASDTFRIAGELTNSRVTVFDTERIPYYELFSAYPIEIIIHAATNYGRDNSSILDILDANLMLPLKLLQYGAERGLRVFINTDTVIDKRVNHYSLSKKQFLDWLKMYDNRGG